MEVSGKTGVILLKDHNDMSPPRLSASVSPKRHDIVGGEQSLPLPSTQKSRKSKVRTHWVQSKDLPLPPSGPGSFLGQTHIILTEHYGKGGILDPRGSRMPETRHSSAPTPPACLDSTVTLSSLERLAEGPEK